MSVRSGSRDASQIVACRERIAGEFGFVRGYNRQMGHRLARQGAVPMQLTGRDDNHITISDFARFMFSGDNAAPVGDDEHLIARVAMWHIACAIVERDGGYPQVCRIELADQELTGNITDHDRSRRNDGRRGVVFDQLHGNETLLILKDTTRKAGKSE